MIASGSFLLLLAFGGVSYAVCDSSSTSAPVASIVQGTLRGKFLESAVGKRKYAAFLSIPYGRPPVGEGRFKEAEKADPWPGVLEATRDAPKCIQMNFLLSTKPSVTGSEDCLYLNVFTPKLPSSANESKLLDVIVYIHEGGFMTFSSSETVSTRLLDRDVVLVTINYRLGPLGFLSTQDSILPGNLGMKDQVLALKWVQNNIAAFGGDPNRVTIAGMSAGAASVHYHTLSPLSKGLFHRGIADSASATMSLSLLKKPQQHAHELGRLLGCLTNSSEALVGCLRKRPADHLIAAGLEIMKWDVSIHVPFVPTVEPPSPTAFLTAHPLEILMNKEAHDVPMLFSFAQHEGLFRVAGVLADKAMLDAFNSNWNAIAPSLLNYNHTVPDERKDSLGFEIKRHYLGNKAFKDDLDQFVKLMSDRLFVSGIEEGAKLQAANSRSPVYAYEFGYKGTKRSTDPILPRNIFDGVSHGENSVYVVPVLGVLDDVHKNDEPMSSVLIDLWMYFITDSPMPGGWKTLQEELPKFGLMKVVSPDWSENRMETYEDYSNLEFWKSLDLDGNQKYYNTRITDEL